MKRVMKVATRGLLSPGNQAVLYSAINIAKILERGLLAEVLLIVSLCFSSYSIMNSTHNVDLITLKVKLDVDY